jgi:hypothetical protein
MADATAARAATATADEDILRRRCRVSAMTNADTKSQTWLKSKSPLGQWQSCAAKNGRFGEIANCAFDDES